MKEGGKMGRIRDVSSGFSGGKRTLEYSSGLSTCTTACKLCLDVFRFRNCIPLDVGCGPRDVFE